MSNMEKHFTWCRIEQVHCILRTNTFNKYTAKSVIHFLYGIFIFMARM